MVFNTEKWKNLLHKRSIESRWRDNACGIEELIWAGRQIGDGKQIDPVGTGQIRAVLHREIVAQHSVQIQQRITCQKLQRHCRRHNHRQHRIGTCQTAMTIDDMYAVFA